MFNYYLQVLQSYAIFSGRARRAEYWGFVLINLLINIGLGLLDYFAGTIFIRIIYSLLVLLPTLAVGVRRMHDVGKSGWFLLIPIYNLILLCTDGQVLENQYGADPKYREFEGSLTTDTLDGHMLS